MSPSLPPAVAGHWPFVRRQLVLDPERSPAMLRAMDFLANAQVVSCGEPVELGAKRLTELGFSPGEAGAVWRALTVLEARRVVRRQRGRGRRPDAWSISTDVADWRRMPWVSSARAVSEAIGACVCRALFGVAARVPGQSFALPRGEMTFMISDAEHIWRPGSLPVDARGYAEERAATPNVPGLLPVDARGYAEASGSPLLSSEKYLRTSLPSSEGVSEPESMSILRKGLPGRVWGAYELRLAALAARLSVDQARAAVQMLAEHRASLASEARPRVPMSVVALEELCASPAIAALAE